MPRLASKTDVSCEDEEETTIQPRLQTAAEAALTAELDAKGIPYRLVDLTGFLFSGLSEEQIESLEHDEFEDYRWMQQGLSKRSEAALQARLKEEAAQIPGGNVIVFATVALYPVVRYGEVLRGLRDLEARIVVAFPGEERGG